jgi:hypothetical protein
MDMGSSVFTCRESLIAEKGVAGQSSDVLLDAQSAELRLAVSFLQAFDINFSRLKHGIPDARSFLGIFILHEGTQN